MQNRGIVIIGAGLTGLSTAHNMKKKGHDVVIVEKEGRIGGQIRTYQEDGFVYESGPNTGVVSFPEVVELFNDLAGDCELEIARESSKRRLIWKGNQFHALPSGPPSPHLCSVYPTNSESLESLGANEVQILMNR